MTYYSNSYKTYEFTAFTEEELLSSGDSNLGCGDTFTMPGSASVCISVTDNDRYLSGDSCKNENADDKYGQQASIEGDGGELGNGGQIYAETYYWVKDQGGNWYLMIEIEQEGTSGDYFTFHNGYGMPPAGAELTIVDACNVKGNWVDYKCLDAGAKEPEPGQITGRLTLDADCNDNEWNEETGQWDEGLEGQTVQLLDTDGNVVAETTTDSYGNYSFTAAPGDYRVKFPEIDGHKFSAKDSGVAEHYDSDADENGLTDVISLSSGECVTNVDAGVKPAVETGTISGTVFCDTDCDGISREVEITPGESYVIEAEDMYDCGFKTVSGDQASGGQLVKLKCAGDDGKLWTDFNGKDGTYDLKIRVQDENDGQSMIKVKIGGVEVDAIRLNGDGDGRGSDNGGFSTYVIEDVAINTGDEIKLLVWGDGCEYVRIDKIELMGEDTTTVVEEPTKAGVTIKLLDLDGNVVDTTVTDADGNYSFENVPVGDYKIMGVAPDGTEFTIKDAGNDDSIDSDVDENGMSDVISVTADSETDIDLGVCDTPEEICIDENTKPVVDLNLQVTCTVRDDMGVELCDYKKSDGKPVELVLTYGGISTVISNSQEGKASVDGNGADSDNVAYIRVVDKKGNVLFSGNVEEGSDFVAKGTKKDGEFEAETFVEIYDQQGGSLLQEIEFHTSCSKSLKIGDQFGSLTVDGATLESGRTFGGTGGTETLGEGDITYSIVGGADADLFEVDPETGEVSFINAPDYENPLDEGADNTYEVIVRASADGDASCFKDQVVEVCVEDVDECIDVDENTTAVTDLNLSVVCTTPGDEGAELCVYKKTDGKPVELTLKYGGISTVISNTQEGKASVDGAGMDSDNVAYIRVVDKKGNVLFSGNVAEGDEFTAFGSKKDGEFEAETFVEIYDQQGGTLLQEIEFHTSCSKSLKIGDQFGSITLDGAVLESGRTFGASSSVELNEGDITYSIVGGADAALFQVDPQTGEVSFINAPDYENPLDAGGDNVYDVIVRATANGDSSCYKEIPLQVCVEDVPEDPGTASLAGRYFCDENDNDRDDAEPAIAGATVWLLDAGGNVVGTTVTDANGEYEFLNLLAGDYSVRFEAPDDVPGAEGKVFVNPDVGDDVDDSDVTSQDNAGNGETEKVTLEIGERKENIDAGIEDPGTASVGDTVWYDENQDGLLNNGEQGVDNVLVKLLADLDNDGTAETVVDSQLTAGGGKYLFDNLHAGKYAVMFTEPDGFHFTSEGADPDDQTNNDSDAGVGGMTETFDLSIGEAERDIDAGLLKDPEPNDDEAMFCADEVVTLDVLANDSDPEGNPLTITMVDGQNISEGQTITTAAGTFVTLSGGQLVIDGEAAWAGLDIGESALEEISYKVSDGTGGTATATMELTFCGDANSMMSFCDSLPASVEYKVRSANIELPIEEFGFDLMLQNTGDARFDGEIFEQAYCLSVFEVAAADEEFIGAPTNTGDMYCADDTPADFFGANQVSNFNGNAALDNLDMVNWILNQDFENNGAGSVNGDFSGWEVQLAIWELTDNVSADVYTNFNSGYGNIADVDYILAQAAANGEGFQAGVGDVVGVVIDPNPASAENSQPFIFAMNWEDYDCLC